MGKVVRDAMLPYVVPARRCINPLDSRNRLLSDVSLYISAPFKDGSLEEQDFLLTCEIAELVGKKTMWSACVERLYAGQYRLQLNEGWLRKVDSSLIKIKAVGELAFLKKITDTPLICRPKPRTTRRLTFPAAPCVVSVRKVIGGLALIAIQDQGLLHDLGNYLRSCCQVMPGGMGPVMNDPPEVGVQVVVCIGRHEYARAIVLGTSFFPEKMLVFLMDWGYCTCVSAKNAFLTPRPRVPGLPALSFWVNLWQLGDYKAQDPAYQALVEDTIVGENRSYWAYPVPPNNQDCVDSDFSVSQNWSSLPIALVETSKNKDGSVQELCLNKQIKEVMGRVVSTYDLENPAAATGFGATITRVTKCNEVFVVLEDEIPGLLVLEAALHSLAASLEDSVRPARKVALVSVYVVKETICVPNVMEECRAFRAVGWKDETMLDSKKIAVLAVDLGVVVLVDPRNVFDLKVASSKLYDVPVKGRYCRLTLPPWITSRKLTAAMTGPNQLASSWIGRKVEIVVSPRAAGAGCRYSPPFVHVLEKSEGGADGKAVPCLNYEVEAFVKKLK